MTEEENWYDVMVSHEWHCTYKVRAADADAAWRLVDAALMFGICDPRRDRPDSFYPDMEVEEGTSPQWDDIVVSPGEGEDADPVAEKWHKR